MSSLAAARADNFYLDTENPQRPTKKLKRNAEGNLTIRFEMPFDTQCLGCHLSIAKGVRFNAEKFKAGSYHSTTIWGFHMKSPCCKTPIEIHTNPKEADYDVVAGVRRKLSSMVGRRRAADEVDEVGGVGGVGGVGDAHLVAGTGASAGGPGNKMSRLESKLTKERVARGSHRNLETLKERSYDRYGEDSERNRELRRSMRSARDEVRRRERRRDELGLCEAVTLLPETKLDRSRASAVVFQAKMHDNALQKRRKIMKQGIFTRKKGTN